MTVDKPHEGEGKHWRSSHEQGSAAKLLRHSICGSQHRFFYPEAPSAAYFWSFSFQRPYVFDYIPWRPCCRRWKKAGRHIRFHTLSCWTGRLRMPYFWTVFVNSLYSLLQSSVLRILNRLNLLQLCLQTALYKDNNGQYCLWNGILPSQ